MKKLLGIALVALVSGGCEALFGIKDTRLAPDAAADAPVDSPSVDAAPPPKVDVGTGKDGRLTVATVELTDKLRTSGTSSIGANSTLVPVASALGFAQGREVLIIQMTGDNAGTHETGFVQSTTVNSLSLAKPLTYSFEVSERAKVQVLVVPHYTSVLVSSGSLLTVSPWDGATGGVMYFRSQGAVTIASGGMVVASGAAGGAAGMPSAGTPGGAGGAGGGRVACTPFCGTTVSQAGRGLDGQSGIGNPGEPPGQRFLCRGGPGGMGGLAATTPLLPKPGALGAGPGGALFSGAGGRHLGAAAKGPVIGGSGAGGDGGQGAAGAAGGGGGGGAVTDSANSGGSPGTSGAAGRDGGAAGAGGAGGGIIWIHATEIQLDGLIDVRGRDGAVAADGRDGGMGGNGGAGGSGAACEGINVYGGTGGAGAGGDGSAGGGGGGGGAGGTIVLEAFDVRVGSAQLRGNGGTGTPPTSGGAGGAGGTGYDGDALPGVAGPAGAAGASGGDGYIFIKFVDTCTACDTGAEPAAALEDL